MSSTKEDKSKTTNKCHPLEKSSMRTAQERTNLFSAENRATEKQNCAESSTTEREHKYDAAGSSSRSLLHTASENRRTCRAGRQQIIPPSHNGKDLSFWRTERLKGEERTYRPPSPVMTGLEECHKTGNARPPTRNELELLKSVKNGEFGRVLRLLKQGTKPNQRIRDKAGGDHHLLSIAATSGNVRLVRVLLKFGALVNAVDETGGGGTALFCACCSGSMKVIKTLVEHGADVHARTRDGSTCMIAAARQNHAEVIHYLARRGVNPDSVMRRGITALHAAVQECSHAAARTLLECGADPNLGDQGGFSPLHHAVHLADVAMTKLLLNGGALAHVQNKRGATPLTSLVCSVLCGITVDIKHVAPLLEHGASFHDRTKEQLINLCVDAILKEKVELVRLFLENGCSCHDQTEEMRGVSMLGIAAQVGNVEIGKLLIERGAELETSFPPLIGAVFNDRPRFAELLLQKGADAQSCVQGGLNCMQLAASVSSGDGLPSRHMMETLIRNGVSVDLAGTNRHTALHLATIAGTTSSIDVLLDLGAYVDSRTESGMTPLHCACIHGHYAAARLLVEKGEADIDCRTKDGSAPLHLAVQNKQEDLVKYLLDHGALVDIPAEHGQTPIMLAIAMQNVNLVKTLLDHGADVDDINNEGESSLWMTLRLRNVRILRLLLNAGADVEERDEIDTTPLLYACRHNHKDVVHCLIQHCADVNGSSWTMDTPLIAAIRQGDEGLVKLLLAFGADVNGIVFIDEMPTSPLLLATHLRQHGMMKFLLAGKADVDLMVEEQTSLILASSMGDLEAVKILLEYRTDVDIYPVAGEPAIIRAAVNRHFDVVRTLARAGANINVHLPSGTTPLHLACLAADASTIQTLLEHGADPFVLDCQRMSALDLAELTGRGDIQQHFHRITEALAALSVQTSECETEAPDHLLSRLMALKKLSSEVEALFICPITMNTMKDPVVAPDGHSYEKSAIISWLELHGTSPMTRQPMSVNSLVRNLNLKQHIELYERTTRLPFI